MIKQTLIVACLIASSGAGGLVLSEAHGHVLNGSEQFPQVSQTPDASAPRTAVPRVEQPVVPAVTSYRVSTQSVSLTNPAERAQPRMDFNHIVSSLAPRDSLRPQTREGLQMAQLSAASQDVVQVTVTRRMPQAATQVQPAAQAVTRGQNLLDAPRERRGILGLFRNNRQDRTRNRSGTGWQPADASEIPFYRNGVFD